MTTMSDQHLRMLGSDPGKYLEGINMVLALASLQGDDLDTVVLVAALDGLHAKLAAHYEDVGMGMVRVPAEVARVVSGMFPWASSAPWTGELSVEMQETALALYRDGREFAEALALATALGGS